jgi:NADH-quinone oxidoreductase subunit L
MILVAVSMQWAIASSAEQKVRSELNASAKVIANHADGAYSVTAAPGLGYSYRWDSDGDGKLDSEAFGDKASVAFNLDPARGRIVQLEVKNAFGQVAKRSFTLSRPMTDKSALTAEGGAAQPQPPRPVAPNPLPPGHPAIPQGK